MIRVSGSEECLILSFNLSTHPKPEQLVHGDNFSIRYSAQD